MLAISGAAQKGLRSARALGITLEHTRERNPTNVATVEEALPPKAT